MGGSHVVGLLALCCVVGVGNAALVWRDMRVLSFNIQHGADISYTVNITRTAMEIASLNPDLVGLQEVDNNTLRDGIVDQTTQLGELTGLWGEFSETIPFQGGSYGIAALGVFPRIDVRHFHFRKLVNVTQEPRGAIAVHMKLDDRHTLWLINTHMSLVQEELEYDVRELITWVHELAPEENFLLTGDFNALPNNPAFTTFHEAQWGYMWEEGCGVGPPETFRADDPSMKIDYVWHSVRQDHPLRVKCKYATVENSVVSDHRPLLAIATIEWGSGDDLFAILAAVGLIAGCLVVGGVSVIIWNRRQQSLPRRGQLIVEGTNVPVITEAQYPQYRALQEVEEL